MGDAGSSMLYLFLAFISIYFVGVAIYLIVKAIKKGLGKHRDSRY